ncbi:MAG: hypothetical protein ABIW76_21805 [Fibrobacteria bacterium]
MKMNTTLLAVAFAAFTITGCAAHSRMRGSVAMKVSDQEAHVCLGNTEVAVGDKLSVYKNDCPSKQRCKKIRLGEAKVTQVLDEHYSVVQFDPGVVFEEGTLVEKP